MCYCVYVALLGSCLIIFIVAALYEGLKVFREVLLRRSMTKSRYNTVALRDGETNGSALPVEGYRTPSDSVR